MRQLRLVVFFAFAILMVSCGGAKSDFSLPYEKYSLENGLEVVLNKDTSDPVVTVAVQYRVGSSREKVGKTGFAHFFEHMLFQRSENLPRNAFFNKIDELGGSFNGFTSQQGTTYFETVPRNALEKVLWMESDRMGFFINTVTEGGLRREIDVVSNEKRQGENKPYGHLYSLLLSNFYPEGHPYSWTVIGEIPDLRSATVEDVKEFYHTYYLPSNATLVISGDFDDVQVKELVEKYFGEITDKAAPERLAVERVTLEQSKKIQYSDSYAPSPLITIAYPAVELTHDDNYALDLLTMLIAGDESSPLYKKIVKERGLSSDIGMNNNSLEIAGMVTIVGSALEGVDLNDLNSAIEEVISEFAAGGVDQVALNKYKTKLETDIYKNMVSTNSKAITMALDNTFSGRPDQVVEDLKGYKAVTAEDIMRVFNKYIKDANNLTISIIPVGQEALAVAGSTVIEIEQESIEQQQISSGGEIIDDPYQMSPSKFDRSIEPELLANTPVVAIPSIWESKVGDIQVRGIEYSELPLVTFHIILGEGMLKDPIDKVGTANLTAALMNEGTAYKTHEELITAIGNLGATIDIASSFEDMRVSGSCLVDKFPEVIALVEEMILYPRWDEESFEVLKTRTIDNLKYYSTLPAQIGNKVLRKALYGDVIESNMNSGDIESVESITLDDLKQYYSENISQSVAQINVVGNLTEKDVASALSSLSENWESKEVAKYIYPSEYPAPVGKVLFVDYPEARQSYIIIGGHSVGSADKDAYPLTIINEKLGGSTSSFLFDILRLKYGYTYGAYSLFSQGNKGLFLASSSVQATVTKESLVLFKDIIENYGDRFDEEMLNATVSTLKSQGYGAYETPGNRLGILNAISLKGLPTDFISQRAEILDSITIEDAKDLIDKYINLEDMVIVVVGDKATQLASVKAAGLGEVVVVDSHGNKL